MGNVGSNAEQLDFDLTAIQIKSVWTNTTISLQIGDSVTIMASGSWSLDDGALDPNLPPSGNFDLSHWKLQLPINANEVLSGTNDATEVSVSRLNNGFTNAYFYTGTDGAITFWAQVAGVAHQAYALQMASSFTPRVSWTPIAASSAVANGVLGFTGSESKNFTQRFYGMTTP